ncbi:gamma-secretase subunit Aph-1 [Harpegnathos saltator]|uniref:Gamma-secretase subunit Aph-1 n=1 Tax=Harpegnathos saltator TaxID=610380 RepID=E2B844_HARSA|nr:gamma-secretase subunit Aph-1 [Harpegnathos saltator]EFN88136.1 Gamma-secretase subunit Aph-1 [Harpegnathos saltator]
MTLMDFFGCAFLAFGLPLAMFTFTIASNPYRIIILIASAFFWLISLLLSSILWYAVVPLQNYLAFGLVFSVLFQESFRYLLYCVMRKVEICNIPPDRLAAAERAVNHVVDGRLEYSYVCGLGFGLMSGAFALVNVLADAVGPGTMGLRQGTEYFFMISAAITLCFILLNTFWGVIFFTALDCRNWGQVIWVVSSHLLVSCMTLLNRYQAYAASILSAYIVLVITIVIAFRLANGRMQNLICCFRRK